MWIGSSSPRGRSVLPFVVSEAKDRPVLQADRVELAVGLRQEDDSQQRQFVVQTATLRRKQQPLVVGRKSRMHIAPGTVGETLQLARTPVCVQLQHVNLVVAVPHRGEGDTIAL